jgi:putative transposase
MPQYRREWIPGGTFFFTLVTEGRAPLFADELARNQLHDAMKECGQHRPFTLEAIVLLPDYLHLLLTLPDGDSDFSTRIASIKAMFTQSHLATGGIEQSRSDSRQTKRRRGVWQRWFWEHAIRDEKDYNSHLDYIHYNPIKHGYVACPHLWQFSSFARHVANKNYDSIWQCTCEERPATPPIFNQLPTDNME